MNSKKIDGYMKMILNRNGDLAEAHHHYKLDGIIAGEKWVSFVDTIRELRALLLALETELMFDSVEEGDVDG